MKGGRFTTQSIISGILRWGTQLIFIFAIVVMAYLSFVENFEIRPNLKNIGLMSVISIVLNYTVWDSQYVSHYNKGLSLDMSSKYSIHKRYYEARHGLKYEEVQKYIREYNRRFIESWLQEVEDITGRNRNDIVTQPYKGHTHKWLIFRLKHRIYPKSGLRTPKDVLNVLASHTSKDGKYNVKAAEKSHIFGKVNKLVTGVGGGVLAASMVVTFVQDGWKSAIFTLLLNCIMLFSSWLFGSINGEKGAKIKLSVAEEISELLEEWKNEPYDFSFLDEETTEDIDEIPPQSSTPSNAEPVIEII